jgi:hypothetical protein
VDDDGVARGGGDDARLGRELDVGQNLGVTDEENVGAPEHRLDQEVRE